MKPLPTMFRHGALALAVLAACNAYAAEGDDVELTVSAGAAAVTGDPADRALFGQYNGLRDDDFYGLLGFGYSRINAASALRAEFSGSNLLLGTRELSLAWVRQGNWGLRLDYGELVRRDPLTVNSGMAGFGSAAPVVNYLPGGPGSGLNFDLETQRRGLGAGLSKAFGPAWTVDFSAHSENKEGSRLFGTGFACPSAVAFACGATTATATGSAVLLLPEPIDSNHTRAEARVSYAGQRLFVSGGYFGSLYTNNIGTLNPVIPGALGNPLGASLPLAAGLRSILASPIALPPDNQAHQFDVTGNYAVSASTRANFRLAWQSARQDQSFAEAGLVAAPAGVTSLNGRVDTSMVALGLSSRPLPKLSLAADWRLEERDDKTPLARYNVEGGTAYTNRNYSQTRVRGKASATYQLPQQLLGTLGADYDFIDRSRLAASSQVSGVSALREETEEIGMRVELRRQLSETFAGAIGFHTSERDGSAWLRPNPFSGATGVADPVTQLPATAVFSPHLADRRRDKVKLFGSWQATDALGVQLAVETGKDRFDTPSGYSLRSARLELYSIDATYAINDDWSLSAYYAQAVQKLNQVRPEGYALAYDNKNATAGLNVNGKLSEKFDLGGGLAYIDDRSVYAQTLDAGASNQSALLLAATGGLPDIVFRRTELRLFGRYALSAKSSLRLDGLFYRATFNDWTWGYNGVPFVFGDNTTVVLQPSQNVTFVGISYSYAFR
jgi:MtrB/PioB family decaheme-associated outer membrane protein